MLPLHLFFYPIYKRYIPQIPPSSFFRQEQSSADDTTLFLIKTLSENLERINLEIPKLEDDFEAIERQVDFLLPYSKEEKNSTNSYEIALQATQLQESSKRIAQIFTQWQTFINTISILLTLLQNTASFEYQADITSALENLTNTRLVIDNFIPKSLDLVQKANQLKQFSEELVAKLVQEQTTNTSLPLDISGTWDTTYDEMILVQEGNKVTGNYNFREGVLEGTLTGNVLNGTWKQLPTFDLPRDTGKFRFIFSDDFFTGQWGYGDYLSTKPWNGIRVK